jgi:hypothetical protein
MPKVFANGFSAANPFGFNPQQAICIVNPAQTGLMPGIGAGKMAVRGVFAVCRRGRDVLSVAQGKKELPPVSIRFS